MKKQILKDSLWYITGSVLYALSVSVFSTPFDIAPGGAAGVAVILHELFGTPVGMVVLLINVPLLVAAFFKLSKSFALRTAAIIVVSSVTIDLTAPLLVAFQGEKLLAALFGGLLAGLGIGLIMVKGSSTGGSEIAARLLQKAYPHLSVGRLILLVDVAVVTASAVVFGEIAAALYAGIQVFVSSLMIDHVVYGREEGRLLLVVTRHPEPLCRLITEQLSRGVTHTQVTGGYTGRDMTMLLCAVSRVEVPRFKTAIRETDKGAFVMVVTTQQVMGEGFWNAQM